MNNFYNYKNIINSFNKLYKNNILHYKFSNHIILFFDKHIVKYNIHK